MILQASGLIRPRSVPLASNSDVNPVRAIVTGVVSNIFKVFDSFMMMMMLMLF